LALVVYLCLLVDYVVLSLAGIAFGIGISNKEVMKKSKTKKESEKERLPIQKIKDADVFIGYFYHA